MILSPAILRRELLLAVKHLPGGGTQEEKRRAAEPWRIQFVRQMFDRKPYFAKREDEFLSNLASGALFDPEKIQPQLFVCKSREDFDVYDYFRMWSSFPTLDRPGRRLKFIVRDAGIPSKPIMGLCCLSSPVRSIRVRDHWIAWQDRPRIRQKNLAMVMDLSTCIGLPPYSYLTAGKLLAAMMASNEVREAYRARYALQRSRIRRRILTDIVLLMTSACYSSNAAQYKGLGFTSSQLFRFIGYTSGYSTFQIPPDLYGQVKKFVIKRRRTANPTRDGGPSAKIRILRWAARDLSISEQRLVYTGHRRAVFAAPLARNWREFLLGHTSRIEYFDYTLECLIRRWKEKWLKRRCENSIVMDKVYRFHPEELRMTRTLGSVGPNLLHSELN